MTVNPTVNETGGGRDRAGQSVVSWEQRGGAGMTTPARATMMPAGHGESEPLPGSVGGVSLVAGFGTATSRAADRVMSAHS
jgi:hypothetical protein